MDNIQNKKIKRIKELEADETKDALDELLGFVEDNDLAVKLTAIESLSFFDAFPRAKNVLIKLTKDVDEEVRYYAVESLESFSGNDVGNAIISKLRDSDELVRIIAAEVLGSLKFKKAIPYLVKVLSDKSEIVRRYSAEAIGMMGNKDLISVLEDKLKKETRNLARLGFYTGLYMLGEKHYFDSILNMLKVKYYRVRCAASNILVYLADEDFIDLTNEYNIVKIIESLNKALSREKTIAAKSSITNALSVFRALRKV
ncbi:MAG: HEAT repeat domain-containing protein [Actinobacteria bacterium]|nr:HEAT repeat domain-containing protein [Actinomycetota bacterium]